MAVLLGQTDLREGSPERRGTNGAGAAGAAGVSGVVFTGMNFSIQFDLGYWNWAFGLGVAEK